MVLRIDVNVGDPVTPHSVDAEYPSLLDSPFHLLGYPLATVLAEKIVTMIERGAATTCYLIPQMSWSSLGIIRLWDPNFWRP